MPRKFSFALILLHGTAALYLLTGSGLLYGMALDLIPASLGLTFIGAVAFAMALVVEGADTPF